MAQRLHPMNHDMRANPLRALWKSGGAAVNGWLAIPNGFAAETMAHPGRDSLHRGVGMSPREPWGEHFGWLEPLFNECIQILPGRMEVPTRPGLGLTLSRLARAWTRETCAAALRPSGDDDETPDARIPADHPHA